MRRIILGVVCFALVLAPLTAQQQQRRIYSDGDVDFAPSSARFVLSADDRGPGLREIRYSVNGGEDRVYEDPIRFQDEGRYVIRYRSIDMTGHVSREKVYTVVIDDTPPELSAVARGQAFLEDDKVFLRTDTAIVVDARDPDAGDHGGSGVDSVYVSLDGRNFLRYSDIAYIDEQGEHTGYAYVVDNVGNRSATYRVTGYVDSTPPSVEIVPADPLTSTRGERYSRPGNRFSVRAVDELSGVESVEISINRGEFVPYTGPVTINERGYQLIRARATDRLGNTSPVRELGFFIDPASPEPQIRAIID
jgi:hypothetical protein